MSHPHKMRPVFEKENPARALYAEPCHEYIPKPLYVLARHGEKHSCLVEILFFCYPRKLARGSAREVFMGEIDEVPAVEYLHHRAYPGLATRHQDVKIPRLK